jgi:hypothetical protein
MIELYLILIGLVLFILLILLIKASVEGFTNSIIVKPNVIKMADHVYKTPFFSKSFCKTLIDRYDKHINHKQLLHSDKFVTKTNLDHLDDNDMKYEPGMTAKLSEIPELYKIIMNHIREHLYPLVNKHFPYFNGSKISPPYILRYESTNSYESKMDIHFDNEQIPVIIYLNDDFEGGGTYFPLFNKVINGKTGDLLFYPGGITHPHGGKKITKGKRYLLLFSIIDPDV